MISGSGYGPGQTDAEGPVQLAESAISTRLPTEGAPGCAQRGHRSLLLVAGLSACPVLAMAMVAVAGAVGVGLFARHVESATRTLDQYMQAMAAGDVPTALALFSRSATSETIEADLRELVNDANGAQFEGYQQLELTDITVNWSTEGTEASVAAIVHYDGDYTGTLEAALQQEGESWRIGNVNVTVPPGKVQDFLKGK